MYYYYPNMYHYPYYTTTPVYGWQPMYRPMPYVSGGNYNQSIPREEMHQYDYGKNPFVVNIEQAAEKNNTFRTAIWTGENLQVTVMSIDVGSDIGLEVHPNVDQFLRIEEGQGLVQMGDTKDNLNFERRVSEDYAIMVPAGKWHNLRNTGNKPLKLYTIYAPPEHPFGTVHRTKADALAAAEHHEN